MSYEFTEDPQDQETQSDSTCGAVPPGKRIGADLLEPAEGVPQRGLLPRYWHITIRPALTQLLDAVVAYFLLDYAVE